MRRFKALWMSRAAVTGYSGVRAGGGVVGGEAEAEGEAGGKILECLSGISNMAVQKDGPQ